MSTENKILKKGDQWKIKLMDPYDFEGKTIEEIDLNGLFDLTGRDTCQIDDQMIARGYSGAKLELTNQYAMLTVSKVCKQPWEFADQMKSRDVIRIKNIVSNFFYTRDQVKYQENS